MSKYILLMNWTEQGVKAHQGIGRPLSTRPRNWPKSAAARSKSILHDLRPVRPGLYIWTRPTTRRRPVRPAGGRARRNVRAVTLQAFAVEEYRRITCSDRSPRSEQRRSEVTGAGHAAKTRAMTDFSFTLHATDGMARRGRIDTPRGDDRRPRPSCRSAPSAPSRRCIPSRCARPAPTSCSATPTT